MVQVLIIHHPDYVIYLQSGVDVVNIVEDPELMEIFGMLYQCMEVPSRITVSCDAYEMFQLSWRNVAQVLAVC
jgi:hypothetical protein